MMRSVLVSVALAALALPQNALACVYSQRPEEVGHASGQYFAKEMLAAATYADLVLVEDDGTRAMDARPTGIITLRTIARFKGNSADRFTVFGNPLTFSPDKQRIFNAPLQHFTSETGQVTPFSYLEERPTLLFPRATGDPPPPPIGLTSCSPPALMAETGRFYVVLRDAEGRVLNRLTMSNGKTASPNHAAFGYVPVTLSDDDFWLWSVRMAAAAPQEAQELLYLTPGSDPVRVERDLRAAGATIRAAYYRMNRPRRGWPGQLTISPRASVAASAIRITAQRSSFGRSSRRCKTTAPGSAMKSRKPSPVRCAMCSRRQARRASLPSKWRAIRTPWPASPSCRVSPRSTVSSIGCHK